MKIGINARTFSVSEPDGAVQSSRRLSHELGKRKDVELTLYGSPELEVDFPEADRIKSAGYYSTSPFFGVIWERTILPLLINSDIDVLLCPNGNAPPVGVGCPVVTYIHDVNAQKGMSSGIHGKYRQISVPDSVRASDAIVTVSNFSKQEILEHLTTNEHDVHVVYNGIDDFYLFGESSDPFELPENYLLYVGAMNPRKNVSRLVKAYEEIRNRIPHKLVLIGPQNKSVYKKFKLDEVAEDIITPGFLPKAQLKYAYENAEGFIYPSLYEGFGMPPLEAMACGTQVVASNRSSLPEILNGYCDLVNPEDVNAIGTAMIEVAASEPSPTMKQNLRAHARSFTWKRAADDLIKVIDSAVKSVD